MLTYFLYFPRERACLFLCSKFIRNWPCASGEKIICSMYFHSVYMISSWMKARSFILTIFNLIHPKMIRANLGWNLPCRSDKEDFEISIRFWYFCYFANISPRKGKGPSFESPLPSSTLLKNVNLRWHQRERQRQLTTNKLIRKVHLSLQLVWCKDFMWSGFLSSKCWFCGRRQYLRPYLHGKLIFRNFNIKAYFSLTFTSFSITNIV